MKQARRQRNHLRLVLPRVLDGSEHVVVLTHVPPFADAALHAGEQSGPHGLPFFACRAVGDVLAECNAGES